MSLDDEDRAGVLDESASFATPGKSEAAASGGGVGLTAVGQVASAQMDALLAGEGDEFSDESATVIAPKRHAPLTPPLGLPAFPGMSSVPSVLPLTTQETPALRITHPLPPGQRLTQSLRTGKHGRRSRSPTATPTTPAVAPVFLRLGRLLVGVSLLGLAWGGAVGVALLALAMVASLREQIHPPAQLALVVVYGVVALWLAIMTGACVVVSAFALRLGLAQRGW